MQIILMEKVVNLGQLGDVVKVRNGYARNFLIPKGKAKRATQTAIAEFEASGRNWKKPRQIFSQPPRLSRPNWMD